MIHRLTMVCVAAGLALSTAAFGQTTPEAKPEDVASMDAILAALYDVISGPAGQKRDWDRMRSLFLDGGHMVGTAKRQNGEFGHRTMDSVGAYIALSGKMLEERGFFEKEIGRHVDTYGNMSQVFSTYEARVNAADERPFMRGINSIQLWNDGKRWWIVSVFWQSENEQQRIPEEYLRN
jgi:hypothetical protein